MNYSHHFTWTHSYIEQINIWIKSNSLLRLNFLSLSLILLNIILKFLLFGGRVGIEYKTVKRQFIVVKMITLNLMQYICFHVSNDFPKCLCHYYLNESHKMHNVRVDRNIFSFWRGCFVFSDGNSKQKDTILVLVWISRTMVTLCHYYPWNVSIANMWPRMAAWLAIKLERVSRLKCWKKWMRLKSLIIENCVDRKIFNPFNLYWK